MQNVTTFTDLGGFLQWCYQYARRSQQLIADHISFLFDSDHGARWKGGIGHRSNSLVDLRIELFTDRIDRLNIMTGKHVQKRLAGQFDALAKVLRVLTVGRQMVQRTIEIVQDGKQIA